MTHYKCFDCNVNFKNINQYRFHKYIECKNSHKNKMTSFKCPCDILLSKKKNISEPYYQSEGFDIRHFCKFQKKRLSI